MEDRKMEKKLVKLFEESIFGFKSALKGSLTKRELVIDQKELNQLVKLNKIFLVNVASGAKFYGLVR